MENGNIFYPQKLDWNIEGFISALDALAYLLNKMAAEKALSDGDRHLLNLLYFFMQAWQAAIAGSSSQFPLQLPGTLMPLQALREGRTLSDGELAVADALLSVCRQWGRNLKRQADPESTQ